MNKQGWVLVCAALATPVWALESLDDAGMSEVNGQAGVSLYMSGSALTLGTAQWQDTDSTTGGAVVLNNMTLTPPGGSQFGAQLDMDVGSASSAGNPAALAMKFTLQRGTVATTGVGLVGSSGVFFDQAFEAVQPLSVSYLAGSGLYGNSTLNINMPSARLYIGQTWQSRRNVMIIDNANINATYTGTVSADATNGLALNGGTLNLNPLSFDIGYGGTQAAGAYSAASDVLINHVGVKGNITNVLASLKGGGNSGISGNTTGIAFALSGKLDTSTLYTYLGGAGAGSYDVEFSKFVPLANYNGTNPSASLGTMTLDVLKTGNVLPDLYSGYSLTRTAAGPGLGMTLRGLQFQAYPSNIDFYNVGTSTPGTIQNWSLITTFYNGAANTILYPGGYPTFAAASQRGIGLSMSFAAQPYDSTCVSTCASNTTMLVADTTAHKYIGLRNVDMRLALDQGQFFVMDPTLDTDPAGTAEPGGMRLTAQLASLKLKGQFAIGNLPDGTAANNFSIIADGQAGANDLFGVGLNIGLLSSGGALSASLKPVAANGGHYLGYDASITGLDPAQTNFTITEPVDGTQIVLGNISGGLTLTNGQIVFSSNSVTFSQTMTLGSASAPFQIGSVNFVPLGVAANTQTLGKIAIPGSTMSTAITLSPK